jgi:pyruvate kinase
MAKKSDKSPVAEVCRSLVQQLDSLRSEMLSQPEINAELLAGLPDEAQQSAVNMLHYLALRSRDLRTQQEQLVRLGLSSLGRLEAHVLPTVEAVLHNLRYLLGEQPEGADPAEFYAACDTCADRLQRNTVALLGPHPGARRVYIMVTMPTEAAHDYLVVHGLLDSGMDCMRINCAQNDPETWGRMIRNLRYAERTTGRDCRVLMDLGGPKLRTGPMKQIPGVIKVRPVRAREGKVLRPARVWLCASSMAAGEPISADASLVVDAGWLGHLKPGDRIGFKDARGSNRTWRVRDVGTDGCWAEARKTAYIMNGVELILANAGEDRDARTVIDKLPAQDGVIELRNGDTLFLNCSRKPGRPTLRDKDGSLLNPGIVSLPIPEIYRDCCPGESVFFDDGRVAGMIEAVNADQLRVRITHTRNPVERLGSDKGINFPDTNLDLPALSSKDLEDLDFAARHADMVGLSFTNGPADVHRLREELCARGGEHVSVVAKIETKRGFNNLPGIVMEALKFPACGVMIARGDLAVETGFERMAEVQEEILWVCESAHVPVIWATQVLEALTKRGHATRAEITDAAMGQAAECVMLNKGPHMSRAVRVLDNILQRMQGHHAKKRSMLRKLKLAANRGRTNASP